MNNEEIKTCTECKKYIKTSYVCEKFTKCEQHEKSDKDRRQDDAIVQAFADYQNIKASDLEQFYVVNRAMEIMKEMV